MEFMTSSEDLSQINIQVSSSTIPVDSRREQTKKLMNLNLSLRKEPLLLSRKKDSTQYGDFTASLKIYLLNANRLCMEAQSSRTISKADKNLLALLNGLTTVIPIVIVRTKKDEAMAIHREAARETLRQNNPSIDYVSLEQQAAEQANAPFERDEELDWKQFETVGLQKDLVPCVNVARGQTIYMRCVICS
jgi:hypothetical protein